MNYTVDLRTTEQKADDSQRRIAALEEHCLELQQRIARLEPRPENEQWTIPDDAIDLCLSCRHLDREYEEGKLCTLQHRVKNFVWVCSAYEPLDESDGN